MGRSGIQRRVPTEATGSRSGRSTASGSPNRTSGRPTGEDRATAYAWTSTSTGWSRSMSDEVRHAGHDHSHARITDGAESPPARRARALEELLIEKRVVSAEDVRAQIDWLVSRTPADGACLVARAWVDERFKSRLLADAREAALELGLDPGPSPVVVAVENDDRVHHLVVCTLCSCYPRALLGPPPAWYKSLPYRSRAVSDPRAVLREFGLE